MLWRNSWHVQKICINVLELVPPLSLNMDFVPLSCRASTLYQFSLNPSTLKLSSNYLDQCRQPSNMSSLPTDAVAMPTKYQPAEDEPICHLFKLPIELRTSIYAEVVIFKSDLKVFRSGDGLENIDEHENPDPSSAIFRPCEPPLLLTCKQIREEALPVFYGGNAFKSTIYDGDLRKFISWLTPEKRLLVKNLRLSPNTDLMYPGPRKPPGCVIRARKKLHRMKKWVEDHDISLRKGALQVYASVSDDVALAWTASPDGKCGLTRCCGRSNCCEVPGCCLWKGCEGDQEPFETRPGYGQFPSCYCNGSKRD